MKIMIATLMLVVCYARSDSNNMPTGLLADYQNSPALGVRAAPAFTWIVPACGVADQQPDHAQVAYQIIVSDVAGNIVWDSQKVGNADSTYVRYSGAALKSASRYSWTVKVWTAAAHGTAQTEPCESATSAPAIFTTALGDAGFANGTQWLTVAAQRARNGGTFAYFRKEITLPQPGSALRSAIAFVTAQNADPLLNAYRLYVDGDCVDVGPGRGEAPVWEGDGAFRSLPYTALDLTTTFSKKSQGPIALALQAMHASPPRAIMQLALTFADGETALVQTDGTWQAFDADVHRKPGDPRHGHSAGTGFIEYIDARAEPAGWQKPNYKPAADSQWSAAVGTAPSAADIAQFHSKMEPPMQLENVQNASVHSVNAPSPPSKGPVRCGAVSEDGGVLTLGCSDGSNIVGIDFAAWGTPAGSCATGFSHDAKCDANNTQSLVTKLCVGKSTCQLTADRNTYGDPCFDTVKTLAVQIKCSGPPVPTPAPPPSSSFVVDFGKELQGGLRLQVGSSAKAGTNVHIACGESLSKDGQTVGSTWGWEFDWTLRDGAQVLEQHKYMECRFVSITFSEAPAAGDWQLSAWKVYYPWVDSDSHFASSNATLDAVWELCRYTTLATSLDTYADSNTRERRPYEADGIIAASARLVTQRDWLWARHSHAWVINDPTWPVEWKQLSAFLGWQDYMATGQSDLSLAFTQQMYDRTMIGNLDTSNGLLDTSKMGRHIVDWMPDGRETDETVQRGEFTASNYMSVSNMFGAHGLELLAAVLKASGERADNVTKFAAQSAALKAQVVKQMWNGTAFCDGICNDPAINGNSRVMSNMFSLCFGMVPDANAAFNWHAVADWGMEQIGDYGAFWYIHAIGSGYYASSTTGTSEYDTPDDGSAMLTALTKCDQDSWCSGLREDNLTTTRESWHDGTYSHGWGASGVVGVVWGIMGVHQTSPAWSTFTVKPKLGSLQHGTLRVPTIRGFIDVTAAPGQVSVHVPCGAQAKLCVPRSASDEAEMTPATARLELDGNAVDAVSSGGHLCAAEPVGCGAGGAPRKLSTHLK